jgi:tetratricopeptide (TPR) repeat protein
MRIRTSARTNCRTLARLIVGAALAALAAAASAQGYQYGDRGPYNYYTGDPQERGLLRSVEGNHLNLLRQKTRHPDPYLVFGECDFVLGKFPNHPEALYLCTEHSATRAKKPEIGQRYLERASQLFPDVASTQVIYGIYLQRLGKTKLAVEKYERGLELDPASRNAHYNLGLAYLSLKEYDLANKHAQQAYALGHPSPGLRTGLQRVGKWAPLPPEPSAAPKAAEQSAPARAETPAAAADAPAPADGAAQK